MPKPRVTLSKLVITLEKVDGHIVPRLNVGDIELSFAGDVPDGPAHMVGAGPGGLHAADPASAPGTVDTPSAPSRALKMLLRAGSILLVGTAASAYLIVPAGGVTPIVPVVAGVAGAAGFAGAAGMGMLALGTVFGGAALAAGGAYYLIRRRIEANSVAAAQPAELPAELKCPTCARRWDRVLYPCGHAACSECLSSAPALPVIEVGDDDDKESSAVRIECPFCKTAARALTVEVGTN